VALSAHPHEKKVTQASVLMVGFIQGSHADEQCVQDPPYQGTAWDEKQQEQLGSNHHEKEGETDHRCHKHSPQEGETWHADLLLGHC
jgi:hypothetical protein